MKTSQPDAERQYRTVNSRRYRVVITTFTSDTSVITTELPTTAIWLIFRSRTDLILISLLILLEALVIGATP